MANALQNRKVLFFIAGSVPTAAEQLLIDRTVGQVGVRSVLETSLYGARAESCDVVAKGSGVTIPAAYSGKTVVTPSGSGSESQDAIVSNGQVIAVTQGAATITVVAGVVTSIAIV